MGMMGVVYLHEHLWGTLGDNMTNKELEGKNRRVLEREGNNEVSQIFDNREWDEVYNFDMITSIYYWFYRFSLLFFYSIFALFVA